MPYENRPPLHLINRRWNRRAWTAVVVLAIVLPLTTNANHDPKTWFVHTLLWSLAVGAACGTAFGLSKKLFDATSDLSAYTYWIIGFPPVALCLFVAEATAKSNLALMALPVAVILGLLAGIVCGASLFLAAYLAMVAFINLAR